jgi:hypothetical protein
VAFEKIHAADIGISPILMDLVRFGSTAYPSPNALRAFDPPSRGG